MDLTTRRKFLLASGVAGGAAIAAGAAGMGLAALLRTAADGSRAPGRNTPKLVLVTLYGGNDGLNTVVPYADPAYHSARPSLAYAPEKVLRLDGSLGLNPMLTGLRSIWETKRLAIVRGTGYPKPDRSHFRSMDIWQAASPTGPVDTGWIGRWLDGTNAPVEAAVSFEPVLPPLLVGKARTGACVGLGDLKPLGGLSVSALSSLGRRAPGESDMQALAADSYANLVKVDRLVRAAQQADASTRVEATPEVPATGTGGANMLAAQLALVAQCVKAGVPTRVYSVSLGGFDTHAAERAGHERLLRQLDEALTGFLAAMAGTEAGRRVTVVVYSEFGRRVHGNASDGTDHGTAGPVFVLGSRVAGGFYGEQPSLTDLDDGDLKANVDFRDIFGAVLSTVLEADPAQYLHGYQPKSLPLFVAD